jgi:hypothetical protein
VVVSDARVPELWANWLLDDAALERAERRHREGAATRAALAGAARRLVAGELDADAFDVLAERSLRDAYRLGEEHGLEAKMVAYLEGRRGGA